MEATNDNNAVQLSEVMDGQSDAVLRPLLTYGFCVTASSAAVEWVYLKWLRPALQIICYVIYRPGLSLGLAAKKSTSVWVCLGLALVISCLANITSGCMIFGYFV